MSVHSSTHITHEDSVEILSVNKKHGTEAGFSERYAGMREYAHKKFVPAIQRAKADDDKQEEFTSVASNLGIAGWILTELALRVSDLADRR